MELIKDHEIAGLVNQLTVIAREYANTQQLRERISQNVTYFFEQKGLRRIRCKDQTKTPTQLRKPD